MGRRLGQHFLVRESILRRIAEAACSDPAETVVEIGPGKGALTRHLLDRAARVMAVEVDPYLVHYLRQKFRENDRLTIVEDDVLKLKLDEWGPAAIAGNLPYYISSPIFTHLFAAANWIRAVFLVQREVADRMTAAAGSRDYGYLTVHAAIYAQAELLFPVSRLAFSPPPKVESAVLRLTPRDAAAEWGIVDIPAFLVFAGLAFQHKRKTLRNNLRERYPAIEGSPEAGLRAEQVPVPELVALFRKLT